jgi:hypothetical protein
MPATPAVTSTPQAHMGAANDEVAAANPAISGNLNAAHRAPAVDESTSPCSASPYYRSCGGSELPGAINSSLLFAEPSH